MRRDRDHLHLVDHPQTPAPSSIKYGVFRSLEEFDAAVKVHGKTLEKDLLIKHHLGILYDQLLESNLLKIIQVRVHCICMIFI